MAAEAASCEGGGAMIGACVSACDVRRRPVLESAWSSLLVDELCDMQQAAAAANTRVASFVVTGAFAVVLALQ